MPHSLRPRAPQVAAFGSLYAGAAVMALLGKWA